MKRPMSHAITLSGIIAAAICLSSVSLHSQTIGPLLTTIWTGAKTGGDPVPGAGVDSRIVADSKFVKFGVPAVNNAGERAFLASWIAPTGKGTGIFAGNTESLLVAFGDAAPDTSGLFAGFRDPMLNNAGRVAFIGKAKGAGVTPADDTGVWSNAFDPGGNLALIAREGGAAPGVPGGVFKSFKSVALGDAGIGFTAFLAQGPGSVTKDDDLGLWIDAGFGLVLVAREGQVLPEGTVKKLTALLPGSLSRGHGNGVGTRGGEVILALDEELGSIVIPSDEPVVAVRVQFTNGAQALYQATPAGLTLVTQTGDQAAGYDPGVNYSKFGIPGPGYDGTFAFLAKAKGPGVSGANGTSAAVWDNSAIVHFLSAGDAVQDFVDATFKTFKDPVANSLGEMLLPAKITGSGITKDNDEGIWWMQSPGLQQLVAREGNSAPGTLVDEETEEHAVFSKFKSLALPEDGVPVFVARLLTGPLGAPGPGNTTKSNDEGAWAFNIGGFPQIFIREGQVYDGKIVKKFAILAAVPGSSSQTRAHNNSLHLLMKVEFTDKSQAIVQVALPSAPSPA